VVTGWPGSHKKRKVTHGQEKETVHPCQGEGQRKERKLAIWEGGTKNKKKRTQRQSPKNPGPARISLLLRGGEGKEQTPQKGKKNKRILPIVEAERTKKKDR